MATFTVTTSVNYTTLTGIVDNDNITIQNGGELTIDTSTVDLRQITNITFGTLKLENTSTTTPIFLNIGSTTTTSRRIRAEAGAIVQARGDKIQIGTGTGVAGQVVTLPQDAGLNNCPDLGGLWVDHGDTLRDTTAVYRPYLQVSTATNACTMDGIKEIFTQDTVLNQVTFATAIPVGYPIYMANIVIKKGASFAAGDAPFTDFANSGTLDLQWVHWGPEFNISFTSAKQVKLDHCTIAGMTSQMNCQNMVLPPTWTNTIIRSGNNTNGINFANSPEAGTHKNCWYDSGYINGSAKVLSLTVTSNGYFEACRGTHYGVTSRDRSENQSGIFQVNGAVNMTFFDCYIAGFAIPFYVINGSSNVVIDNTKFMHGNYSTDTESENMYCFRGANCNVTVTRFYHQDPSVYGGFHPTDDAILLAGGSNNCTFDDVVLYAGVQQIDAIINDAGVNSRYNNITLNGTLNNKIIDYQTASLGLKASNIVCVDQQTQTSSIEFGAGCEIDQVSVGRNSNTVNNGAVGTGTDCLSAMLYEFDDTDQTAARYFLRMSPTVNETDYLTIITQTGQIVFNNNNRLYMSTLGDEIELEGRVHYNISSCNSSITNGNNVLSGWTIQFALRRPNGTYTSWQDFTTSGDSGRFNTALGTLAADAQNRVQIKFKLTRDVSNVTDYIQQLGFDLLLTGDPYPFQLVPDPTLTVEANVDLTGAEVRIYDNEFGTNNLGTELAGVESSAASTFSTDALGTNNLIWIQILKDGYVEFGQAFTIGTIDTTFTATLQVDNNA